MKIDFENVVEERLECFKGGTGVAVLKIFKTDDLTVLKGYLEPHSSIGYHRHDDSNETIYVFGGNGKVIDGDTEYPVTGGSCSFCPKGGSHSLVNTSDVPLFFMGVVPKV